MSMAQTATLKKLDATSFIQDKTRDFVGRESLFKEVEEWRIAGSELVLIVKGHPGIGKSAWAATLVTREASKVAASHFCRYDDPKSLRGDTWLENVVAQLLDWAQALGFSPDKDCMKTVAERPPALSLMKAWCRFLDDFGLSVRYKGPTVFVVVDSLDEAVDVGGAQGAQILEILSAGVGSMPPWLKIVATSRDEAHVLEKIQGSLPGVKEIRSSDEENLRDLREFVKAQMGSEARMEDIETVLKASDGNFMFAVQLLRHKVAGDLDQMLTKGSIPLGLQELYSAMVHRLFPKEADFERLLPLLNVLAAAKAPLPRTLFDAAMNAAGLTETAVSGLLHEFAGVLEVSESIVRIYHKSFGDWLVETGYGQAGARTIFANVQEGHDLLAKAGAGQWPAEKGSYVDSFTCAHAVEGCGYGVKDVIKAIGGVDVEAGQWYEWYEDQDDDLILHVNRHTMMWMASSVGNSPIVRALVVDFDSKAIDTPSKDERTPLWIAASHGHTDVVRALGSLGSKAVDVPNDHGESPLYIACSSGHHELVKALIRELGSMAVDKPNEGGRTPVWIASMNGHLSTVQLLVDDGKSQAVDTPDVDGETPLFVACSRGLTGVARALIVKGKSKALDTPTKGGRVPLWVACQNGHLDMVRALLGEFGSQAVDRANASGETPLWVASANGHADVAEALLTVGKSQAINQPDELGWTPLYAASRYGHLDAVRVLTKTGTSACVDQVNARGETPLYTACAHGHKAVVLALLKECGSLAVDIRNHSEQTPLWAASDKGHVEVVRVLLRDGQSQALDRASDSGETPLWIASCNGHLSVVQALVHEFGSKSLTTPAKNGRTPLDVAFHKEIEQYLRDQIGKEA